MKKTLRKRVNKGKIKLNPISKTSSKLNGKDENIVKRRLKCVTIKKSNTDSGIMGREKEYEMLKNKFNAFIEHKHGSIVYISGVPGSGKTHTVKHLIKKAENLVFISFVNCAELKAKKLIYKKIAENLICLNQTPNNNLQGLRSHILGGCKHPHLIVIDEIDLLVSRNETMLYNLFELPFIESSNTMLIILSNSLGTLSSKIES